jgi:hypothetical protein
MFLYSQSFRFSFAGVTCFYYLLFFYCLMVLSISRPYSVGDKIANEYGVAGGMNTGRRNKSTSTWRKLGLVQF